MLKINSKINFVRILSGLVVILGLILVVMAITAKVASENKPAENTSIPSPSSTPSSTPVSEVIKNNSIFYVIDSGDGKKIYDGILLFEGNNNTVFSILKKLSEVDKAFDIKYNYNYPKLGVLVESIGGIKGDTEKYWQFYINGQLGQVAADKQELKAGDKVEWKFEKTNF